MTELPRVAALVLAAAVDALPNRLRKKLDDVVATAANWPVTVHNGQFTVMVDDATTVTLSATDGMLTGPEQATCTCLLAPNCLHRVAVLARAPVDDGAPAPSDGTGPTDGTSADGTGSANRTGSADGTGSGDGANTGGATGRATSSAAGGAGGLDGDPLTGEQRAAAEHLWQAGIAVLGAGVSGSGVVLRTALLRATHEARVHGLHRAAAAGRQVAAHLHAARERQPQYRLPDLTDDLSELLLVTRKLRGLDLAPTEFVGTARRRYDVRGSLRLYGLCSVPVVAESGYAGVVTYLADRDGRLWTVADLMPGGEERAAAAGDATVALGEAALTHRALGRGGLVVSGATASDVGSLGAGKAVKAVQAGGVAWTAEPLAKLWETPLDEQVRRAFAALALPVQDRPAGADLLFLAGRVLGADTAGVQVGTGDGTILTLTVASGHATLPYRENLALLGGANGVELLIVGRPDPARRQTVHPLALSTVDLALPAAWAGHLDLGFDRLQAKHFPAGQPAVESVGSPVPKLAGEPVPEPALAPPGDLALHLVRRHAERVVAGGRAVQALAAPDERRLRAARLDTGAALLRALTTAAQARARDAFGRPLGDDTAGFADAWLSVAVYEQAASWALNQASWLPGNMAG